MKNLWISNLDKKDAAHCTTDVGLYLRRKWDKPFKILCNRFTNAHIIRADTLGTEQSDETYFSHLEPHWISPSAYPLSMKKNANNIVLERYPRLDPKESYIFVGNHTCPEDIETMLNILDRNAYLILGSVETLKYDPEMYLSWLNGMIVFDILDPDARKGLMPKMERVLKTNSILIFPEGSHNYHPNKLVNHLFDGPVNLALRTGKKIVPVTLLRDGDHRVSYIDVGNPLDMRQLYTQILPELPRTNDLEKQRVNALSRYLRDKMATAVYYLIARHAEPIHRGDYPDIDRYFIDRYVEDAFSKLKWRHDVFEAEYLTKKTQADRDYADVVHTLSNLQLGKAVLPFLNRREYILKALDLERKDVPSNMRKRFYRSRQTL